MKVSCLLHETGEDYTSGSIVEPIVGEELKQYAYSWIEQRKCFYSLDYTYGMDIVEKGQKKEKCQPDDEFDLELKRALELS